MIINSYQTAKEKRDKQVQKILLKQRLYEIQNNDSYNCFAVSKNEISTVNQIQNEFEITKQNKLLAFSFAASKETTGGLPSVCFLLNAFLPRPMRYFNKNVFFPEGRTHKPNPLS